MQSLYSFIIQPKNGRYTNEVSVGDKKLIINTTMDDHKFVNRVGVVMSVPLIGDTDLSVGDEVIVHHNVFRRFYDVRGIEKNSSSYFKEDLYFCNVDQIYLYKRDNKWITNLDYCFVHPIVSTDDFNTFKEQELLGIVKYSNSSLEAKGINPGALITFTPNSEFEFIVNGERLYCMKSNDIALTHEYQEDKVKYNPSWAQSR